MRRKKKRGRGELTSDASWFLRSGFFFRSFPPFLHLYLADLERENEGQFMGTNRGRQGPQMPLAAMVALRATRRGAVRGQKLIRLSFLV